MRIPDKLLISIASVPEKNRHGKTDRTSRSGFKIQVILIFVRQLSNEGHSMYEILVPIIGRGLTYFEGDKYLARSELVMATNK